MFISEYTEKARADDTEALFQILCKFAEGFMLDFDSDMALETVADDIIGIGLGEQGYYKSKAEMRAIVDVVLKTSADNKPETVIDYKNVDIRLFSPDCATLNAEIHLTTEINGRQVKSGVLQMASARKENGKWQFIMLQALPLALSEDSIEAYPLKFADEALAKLKGELQTETFELMNESFSGGIFGTRGVSFKLEREKTTTTPYVLIDEENGYMKFEGRSYLEDIHGFYEEITEWLGNYISSGPVRMTFECSLEYFNSSTTKLLYNMLRAMDKAAGNGAKVTVNWIADEDNDMVVECGEDFGDEMEHLEFVLVKR